MRVILLTVAALIGFASNSLLCRAALLGGGRIDPATFTTVRVASGALTLLLIAAARGRRTTRAGNWISAAALFLYAIAFSLAYVKLTTSTGALILFGVVQLTMMTSAIVSGERPGPAQIAGLVIAFAGLVILCAPGVRAPDPIGAALMAVAGIAWGAYSLRGRRSGDPLPTTAGNFARAVPFALAVSAIAWRGMHVTAAGALLAAASGALASGVGYTLWYAALPSLTATRASIVQLSVPVIAAAGGILILGETLSIRLLSAAAATIGGVLLAMRQR